MKFGLSPSVAFYKHNLSGVHSAKISFVKFVVSEVGLPEYCSTEKHYLMLLFVKVETTIYSKRTQTRAGGKSQSFSLSFFFLSKCMNFCNCVNKKVILYFRLS